MRLLRSHLLWKTIGSTLVVLYIIYIKKVIEKVYAYTFFFINVKNIYKKKIIYFKFSRRSPTTRLNYVTLLKKELFYTLYFTFVQHFC